MINLTSSSINPSFIEEAVLGTGHQCSDGGYYITLGHARYWSSTQTAVVVYFASGRIKVYGGDDANTIWVHYHGKPAIIDSEPHVLLEGHGLTIKVYEEGDTAADSKAIFKPTTYSWACNAPTTMRDADLAQALLHLLVDNGYIYDVWVKDKAYFDGGGLSAVDDHKGSYLLVAFKR